MAYDAGHDVIFVSDGGQLDRFDVATGSLLSPLVLGGNLRGLDISPDGHTLAVADASSSTSELWIHLIDLDSLAVQTVPVAKAFSEAGSFSVAYTVDGDLLVTSDFNGSGSVPMRRLDTTTSTWQTLASVQQRTMLAASGDFGSIAFAEANISDGRWGAYDVLNGTIARRSGYTDGTSWFNFEIAANADGSQFAIPTYGGTMVYDSAYQKMATIGQYAGPQPIGVAYHPVEPLVYFPWAESSEVKVYDANSLLQVGSYDFQDTFKHTGNWAYQQGRVKLSGDGSLLMVTVTGGVRFERMYAPLTAGSLAIEATAGQPVSATLDASVGNGGVVALAIDTMPAHGVVQLDGDIATYVADAGYAGADRFTYSASYGKQTVNGVVDVAVVGGNHAPVAVGDVAYARNWTVSIDVLANDSDADGDALSLTSVTHPRYGSAVIRNGVVVYTPPKGFHGSDSFSYVVSDGHGESDTAQVTIYRY